MVFNSRVVPVFMLQMTNISGPSISVKWTYKISTNVSIRFKVVFSFHLFVYRKNNNFVINTVGGPLYLIRQFIICYKGVIPTL